MQNEYIMVKLVADFKSFDSKALSTKNEIADIRMIEIFSGK